MRYIYIVPVLVLLHMSVTFTQEKLSTLEDVVERAVSLSPEVEAFQTRLEISRLEVQKNSNLPDPQLGLSFNNLPVESFRFDEEPMTGKAVSLSQSFPFPGKLSKVADMYEADIQVASYELDNIKSKTREQILGLLYDLSLIQNKIKLEKEKQTLYEALKAAVKTKYENNLVPQQNLIMIQFSLTRIQDVLTELSSKEDDKFSEISGLLYTDFRKDVSVLLTDTDKISYDTNELISLSQSHKANLLKYKALQKKSLEQEQLAEYEFYPNFNVGVQYTQRDALRSGSGNLNDFLTFKLGMNIPLNYGGKKSAGVLKTQKLQELYISNYNKELQWISIEINKSIEELTSLDTRINLLQEALLPQSMQFYKSSLGSYQVGKVDFINVIESMNKLIDLEKELYQLRNIRYKKILKLEYQTGVVFIENKIFEVGHEK